jgi:hypothetical protein
MFFRKTEEIFWPDATDRGDRIESAGEIDFFARAISRAEKAPASDSLRKNRSTDLPVGQFSRVSKPGMIPERQNMDVVTSRHASNSLLRSQARVE